MAERRKPKKRKDDKEQQKPSKQEYAVAKYVRFNCPTKKSTLFGQKVDYFNASKSIDCLLDSKWAVNTKKAEALFTTRESVVQYMDRLLNHQCFFHRAEKLVKTVPLKKKKKKEDEETGDDKKKEPSEKGKEDTDQKSKAKKEGKSGKNDSDKEKDAEPDGKKKEKKKVKLEPHNHQIFLDGNEVYVWTYDPVSTKTFCFGLLVVLGAIAICLFPLWPPEIRTGVYYLSLSGIGLIGSLLGLSLLRYIIFFIVWCITFGKLHFWLFPNLDADCGFKESFMPFYSYDYKSGEGGCEGECGHTSAAAAGTERRESGSESRESAGEDATAATADTKHTGDNDDDSAGSSVGKGHVASHGNGDENDDDFEVIQESDVVDHSPEDENNTDSNPEVPAETDQ